MKIKVTDRYGFYQKLNYNCPESEKSGSGPGSCSGSSGVVESDSRKADRSTTIVKNKFEKIQKIADPDTRFRELRAVEDKLILQRKKDPESFDKSPKASLLKDIRSHAEYARNDADRESNAKYEKYLANRKVEMQKDKEMLAPKDFLDKYQYELMSPEAEIKFPNVLGKSQSLRIGDKITIEDKSGFWQEKDKNPDGTVTGRIYGFDRISDDEGGVGLSLQIGSGSSSNVPISQIRKVEKLDPSMSYDSMRRETYNTKQREEAIKKYKLSHR